MISSGRSLRAPPGLHAAISVSRDSPFLLSWLCLMLAVMHTSWGLIIRLWSCLRIGVCSSTVTGTTQGLVSSHIQDRYCYNESKS
ncbi:hypothetical protein N657DRAFT_298175 [Parathielavia appendiculata]|uniref:Uncharacterized protein n=1 Tax=Parathielavia appendiculata TaxID=2587402 RepID=A0AAN6Z5W3_9PEZI|nr:hypothetical protein N657DRAFT_298175 [Parathielavia appendiculata]